MGVYRVHNTVNDKSFVGTSIDLPSMLNRQQAQLRMGRHPNPALQRDWNQLGADGFEFEILDTLGGEDEVKGRKDALCPDASRTR